MDAALPCAADPPADHPGLHLAARRWRYRHPRPRWLGYLGGVLRCAARCQPRGDLDRCAGHVQCQSEGCAGRAPADPPGLLRGAGNRHHRRQGAAPALDQAVPRCRRTDGHPRYRAPGTAGHQHRRQRRAGTRGEGDQPPQRHRAGVDGRHRHVAAGRLPGRCVQSVQEARPVGGPDRFGRNQRHRVAGSVREPGQHRCAGRAVGRPVADLQGEGDRAVCGDHPGWPWHAFAAAQAVGRVGHLRPRARAHDLAVVQ